MSAGPEERKANGGNVDDSSTDDPTRARIAAVREAQNALTKLLGVASRATEAAASVLDIEQDNDKALDDDAKDQQTEQLRKTLQDCKKEFAQLVDTAQAKLISAIGRGKESPADTRSRQQKRLPDRVDFILDRRLKRARTLLSQSTDNAGSDE